MDYKIEFIPALGTGIENHFEKEFKTLEESVLALESIANYTLFLHRQNIMPEYSNCGMIYKKDGEDWIEVGEDGFEL